MGIRAVSAVGSRSRLSLLLVLVASIVLAGCAVGEQRALVDSIAARSESLLNGDALPSLETLLEPPAFGVVGTVVAVRPGVGMWWEDTADGPVRHIVEIDDPAAEVTTVELAIQVEVAAFGPGPDPGDMVTAGIVIGREDPAVARDVFLDERLFAVLVPSDPAFDYDADIHGIALEGSMLARPIGNGELDWFLAPPEVVRVLDLGDQSVSRLAELAGS